MRGHYRDAPVAGNGYVELTGYANPLELGHEVREPHLSR